MAKKPKNSDSKGYAFVATFFSIVGFIIALLAWRKDKYTMFYAKQSLVLFIVAIAVSILSTIVGWIPILGTIISVVLQIFMFVLWLLSWIYALSGEEKYVPIFGHYADKIDL